MAAPWAEMIVTPETFKEQVAYTGLSYRGFAEEVSREMSKLRRKRRKSDDPIGCSHTVIARLANGDRTTVHPLRAMSIERAARQPRGSIFPASSGACVMPR